MSQDLFGDLTTVSFGFSQGWDEVRKNGDNAFEETVDRRNYRFGLQQIVTPRLMAGLNYEVITDEGFLNNPYRSVRYLDDTSARGFSFQPELYPHTRTSNAIAVNARYYLPYRAADPRRVPLLHRHLGHRRQHRVARLHAPVGQALDLRGGLSLVRPVGGGFLLRPVPACRRAELPGARQGTEHVHEPHVQPRRDLRTALARLGPHSAARPSTCSTIASTTSTTTSATSRTGGAPGTEELYGFDADVFRLFVSGWF